MICRSLTETCVDIDMPIITYRGFAITLSFLIRGTDFRDFPEG